jgi:putative ABC transport system permease protein
MGVLDRKLFRGLRHSWGQTAAVALVILCGTATYIAIGSAYRNLLLTRDSYYQEYRFADFEIMVERSPQSAIFKIETIPGVRRARGRIVKDVNVDIESQDQTRTGRIISMPNRPRQVLNDIHMVSGRYFDSGVFNEVILSDPFAEANNISLGDQIQASIDNKKHTLRVVGTALSPEYVYMIRTVQEMIPSPERFGILWVPEDFAETALDMREACNNIIGAVDDPASLELVLDEADKILEAHGVFSKVKQENQISNRFVSDEITGLGVNAKITPTIFLTVAALILMVLLSRMVRNERTQIGLLKAYGYSDWHVSFHYVKFALILGVAGCVGGFFAGQYLANSLISMYVMFYDFPILRTQVYPEILARSMGISVGFATLGALVAARQAARLQPAEAMRPAAPIYGTRTLFERIGPLWRMLSFTGKIICRNVARNPLRSSFNVVGIAVSTGLLFIGFFSLDAMMFIFDEHFSKVQREDMTVNFVTELGKDAHYEFTRIPHVRRAEPMLQYPFTLRSAWREKDLVVIGLPKNARLQRLVDGESRPVDVGEEGLVLSQRIADELRVDVGSVVELEPLMGRITKTKEARVSQVVQQYLGASAYMNIAALSRVLDEPYAMNAVLVQVEEPGTEQALNAMLKDVASVAAVSIKAELHRSLMDTLAMSMRISNGFIIFFAGVIAFAIIYNLTMVSLAERERELTSLRVLGFTEREVGRILFQENFVLAGLGVVLGIPLGMGLCLALVNAYNTDLYRLPFHLEPESVAISAGFIVLFIVLANLAVYRRLHKLDMVEVLKSRE